MTPVLVSKALSEFGEAVRESDVAKGGTMALLELDTTAAAVQQEPRQTRVSIDDLSFGVPSWPGSKHAVLMGGLLSDETAMTCPWTRQSLCSRRISHHGGLDDPLLTDCENEEVLRHATPEVLPLPNASMG